jgi:hypothetical protein
MMVVVVVDRQILYYLLMWIFEHDVNLIDVYDHAFEYVMYYLRNLLKEVEEYMLYVVDEYLMIQEVNY